MASLTGRARTYVDAMQKSHGHAPDLIAVSAIQALARFLALRDQDLSQSEVATLVAVGAALLPAASEQLDAMNHAERLMDNVAKPISGPSSCARC